MSLGYKSYPKPSVMKHEFSNVPKVNMERSSFKKSHGYKTTLDEGFLIPIYVDEALPGDTFKLNLSSVCRLTTLAVPVMDNLFVDFFFFAVPNRLLWDNWQRFMGEQDNPADSIDFLVPHLDAPAVGGFTEKSLSDYFGIPTKIANISVNSLHYRAYNLIWNQWFRDQNLQDSVHVDKDDGPDSIADYVLLKRGKRHDYFTSCLPWPQKGDGVELPLGDTAPVRGLLVHQGNLFNSVYDCYELDGGGNYTADDVSSLNVSTHTDFDQVYADLSAATASTINSLREAFQLQKMLERDARGGTRYTEIIKSHFKVDSPDERLQRPEYLGGGSKPLTIEPVPMTNNIANTPLGDLGGLGFQNQSGIGFTKSFVEHCVLIGLISIRADLTYQKGLDRMWSRQTKYDFYWPALAHLGEQAVLNKEIYIQDLAADDEVFGYQERWAEYKYSPSLITGLFRSNCVAPLDYWHLSQEFAALPTLNAAFIAEDPPVSRIVAIVDENHFVFDAYFDLTATRPMPVYSVPGLIDHF